MNAINQFPLRQKLFLGFTIIAGLFLLIAFHTRLFQPETTDLFTTFYGFGVPLWILSDRMLIDLNDKKIFAAWGLIGIIFLAVFLLSKNPDKSLSTLRSLPAFLVAYWLINSFLKRMSGGAYIVNTLKQSRWYHDVAKRKIDWLDVLINMFLVFVILFAGLYKIN